MAGLLSGVQGKIQAGVQHLKKVPGTVNFLFAMPGTFYGVLSPQTGEVFT